MDSGGKLSIDKTEKFGLLKWKFEEPSKSVDFLHPIITIETNTIVTKTFQKVMNLNQYISSLCNHPPSMIKGIIYSILCTCILQSTYR